MAERLKGSESTAGIPGLVDPRRSFRRWALATAVAASVSIGGAAALFFLPKEPDQHLCTALTIQSGVLERTLFEQGTLGSEGGLLIRTIEIRDPTDPRVAELGQLKNQRDRACALAKSEYDHSWKPSAMVAAIFGGTITLFGLMQIRDFRRAANR